ncbi:DUF6265 family protein [Candidatus Palauibacter sp.]|uniref:DUF6265 family protein n=1 Tax=Candidatus Palauibacter sp. TaxID=3101350 RepID=UPI003B019316
MRPRSARGRPAAFAVLTCAGIALAADGLSLGAGTGDATAVGTGAAHQAPDLEDLAWIAGHWGGEAMGGQIEEAWFGPAGRSMSGSFRLVRDDLAIMYELLLLEQDEDGEIYYRFKHVGRGWEPREETPLEFRLTELEGRRATFRNTAPEPPENGLLWFTYESPTDDELRVTIHGSRGGAPTVLPMTRR